MYILNVYKMHAFSPHRRYHSKSIRKRSYGCVAQRPTSFWAVYTPGLHRRGLVDFSPVAPEKRYLKFLDH